jgi:uncharacterized protein YegL
MCQLYSKDVVFPTSTEKGDWLPLTLIITDGCPSDTALFNEMCEKLKLPTYSFSTIVCLAVGQKAESALRCIPGATFFNPETCNSATLSVNFKFVPLKIADLG